MPSEKSKRRAAKSVESSAGDRRSGSVGERPELRRSGHGDANRPQTAAENKRKGIARSAED